MVLFAVGIVAAIAPLLQTRVLPFHDSAGIVGLGGALALRDDPAAHVAAFYDLDVRAYPSALYFGWAYLAGLLGISIETAFSAFLILFCICGPPLALWLLLRAFGRPPALALFALPVSYHHQVWYGFLGSSAAITGMIAALAFAQRLRTRNRIGPALGLGGAVLFVAAAHPFSLALTLIVVGPTLLLPSPTLSRAIPAAEDASVAPQSRVQRWALRGGLRFGALVPTAWFLSGWAAGFFGRGPSDRSLWRTVKTSFAFGTPAWADAGQYLAWLGNGYRAGWDEWVPAVALATLAAFLIFGARVSSQPTSLSSSSSSSPSSSSPSASLGGTRWSRVVRSNWLPLAWAAAILLVGYLFLPMKLVWPELWWGVRVRCVLPSYLVLIALVRPVPFASSAGAPVETRPRSALFRRGLPLALLIPMAAVAVAFLAYVTWDFHRFARDRLAGFDAALAAIPPGQSVLAFPVRPDPHFTLPHPYLVQHYVARKGGRAVPHLRGHRGSYWITMKLPPASPPWGDPRLFDFRQHSDWDYFLIERPIDDIRDARPFTVPTIAGVEDPDDDAPPDRPHPMREAPAGSVRRVTAEGQFEVWQRLH